MYKLLTKILLIIMNIGTVVMAIFSFCNNDFSRIATFIAIFPVLMLPFFFKKTKLKLTNFEIFLYYSFIFLADFLGCVLNFYNLISWYDLFTHFLSGIATFTLGFILLKQLNGNSKKIVNIIFCLGVVCIIALLWEMFEFGMDSITGSNLQHNLDTGVADTMWDMIAAFVGGFISSLIYYKYS